MLMIGWLMKDEQGASMAEYAMMLALIAVAALGAVVAFGGGVESVFDFVGVAMDETGADGGS
jgi:Flp pilus assembly pilin Flp